MSSPKYKLHFLSEGQIIKKIAFQQGQHIVVTIGKDEKSSDIVIPLPQISRQHAQLVFNETGILYIMDLGSTNGTYLNGNKIQSNQLVLLNLNDKIKLANSGDVEIQVLNPSQIGSSEPPSGPGHTNIIDKFKSKNIVNIGRGDDCDIKLQSSAISRSHCSIEKLSEDTYKLKDNDSLNGTFVNGKKIKGSVKITAKDKIMIGRFVLTLQGQTKDLTKEIAIRSESIIKTYPNGFVGLNETTISVPSSTLLAIMGPSGCGKSTLMKALNGESPATKGKVFLFEQELLTNFEYLKTQIGYVPQDDIVHRELTVKQSLYYAAKLRLDNPSEKLISDKINQVLNDLNISHIKEHLVSKISGGQRKRVSIAVELLNDPLILFLDEPTSPLDPQTIEEFLGILKRLADKGTTVVMVTHKPEDLAYMDQVIFMAEGGHLVYQGGATDYQDYFEVSSPVKVYLNLTGEYAKKWITKYNQKVKHNKSLSQTNQDIRKSSNANPIVQWRWLTQRYLNIKLNDKINSVILIAQAPIIAGLICLIFDKVSMAVPFLMAISAVWFGVNNAAREIVGELPIYQRERMFNVMLMPYVMSKLAVLSLFSMIQAFLFVFIIQMNFSGEEVIWGNPMGSFVWMFALSIGATLMGLLLSATVSTSEKVMTLVPITLIPQLMLAGVVTKISSGVVEMLSYLTLSRWGTEGFMVIQKDVVGTTVEIKDKNAVDVDVKLDSYGNAEVGEIDLGEDNFQSLDEVQNGIDGLHDQFHSSYLDRFGEMAGTIELDAYALLFMSLFFFAGIIWALKKKDSIPRQTK